MPCSISLLLPLLLWAFLACMLGHFSCIRLCNPMEIAHQAPLSMGFSRQEYWSGLPCPPPGDLPGPGIESSSPALQTDSLLLSDWEITPIFLCLECLVWSSLSTQAFYSAWGNMCKGFSCTVAALLNQETLEGMAGWHRVDAQGCACGGGAVPENSCPLRMDRQRALGPGCLSLNPGFTTY